MVPVIGPGRPSPPGPVVPVIWLGRPSSPLGPVVPVKGSVCWPPVRSPGQGRAPRSVAWGARRPPTTRLALTWVISLGGGIYRVGARRGATPPSTPVHEVDCGQGSSGPETYIYIYIRPVAAPLPATTQGSRSPATPSPAGTQTQPARSLAPSWSKAFGAPDGTPPSPFLPDSLPFAAPPICSSFAANWRMLGAYRDRRPEPLPPTPGGERPGPWSPLPIGTHAHDEIDPPGPPRFPPACHAMLDGRTARWPRSMQRRPLSGYRHTATSLRHHAHDGAPCLKGAP